jgi:hypothetical protein
MLNRRLKWAGVIGLLGLLGACSSRSAPPTANAPNDAAVQGGQAYGQPGAAPPPSEMSPDFGGGDSGGESFDAESAPSPEPAPNAPKSGSADLSEGAVQKKKETGSDRPGLATQWGETRTSKITTVPFLRGDPETPFAMVSLFYNDEQGARAMANFSGFRRVSDGTQRGPGGVVTVGLRGDDGRFLSGYQAGGKNYVIGEAGARYTIVVKSNAPQRVEAVISVDGLDVLDGKPASFKKRGYLIEAGGEVAIDGFRQSTETVAAFRFGSVRDSYAEKKHGDSRNVGVIGVAVFHERGSNPHPWTVEEVDRRNDANPFPGQFATPP